MLWRNNSRKNSTDVENRIEETLKPEEETLQPEEKAPKASEKQEYARDLEEIKQSEATQKTLGDIHALLDRLEQVKQEGYIQQTPAEEKAEGSVSGAETAVDAAAVAQAEKAVLRQAVSDAEKSEEELKQKVLNKAARSEEAKAKQQEIEERRQQKIREAEEKRAEALEAKRKVAELTAKKELAQAQAEINENRRLQERLEADHNKTKSEEKLKEVEEKLRKKQQEKERKEAERIARLQAAEKKRREAAEAKRLAEEKKREIARQKQEKKAERDRLIAEQREIARAKREEEKRQIALQKQQEKEKKEELRRLKIERETARNEEKAARKARIKKERAERNALRKKKRIAEKSAEMGGGIVNVHGTTVQTEIQPVAAFSLRDLVGATKRKEIAAAQTEEEKKALIEENEKIKADARQTAASLAKARKVRRDNGPVARKIRSFFDFCEERKNLLLVVFSIVLLAAVGTAGVFNFCTAYKYSYNGTELGYVKNKDDVLQITEMVQSALSEEKNVDVVIDARDDISFERVSTVNKDIVIDTSDDVLKRLTYMGDINVKAYGIYLDGKKAGAVESKEIAANVLRDIQDKYASHKKGSEIRKAVIVEDIDIRRSNTPLGELMSEEAMVDMLCTDTVRETVHTVERGETLKSIAQSFNLPEDQIVADNEGLDPEKLEVGSTVLIKETAPLMTVRITEVRTHEEKIEYKTVKKKDKTIYEGSTETEKKGEKGTSLLTDRTVTVNGQVVKTKVLKNEVKKEPVDKVVLIGVKEKPPTVGTGTYIWPAYKGTYTVTSEFKWRWGRQHEGIDMGCSTGNDVLAADGGTVTHAGWMGGYGNLVIIDHENGIETYYGHNSSIIVKVGDKVFQGQHIAEAGNTGNSFGSHIHFGVKDHGTFKNPRNYLP